MAMGGFFFFLVISKVARAYNVDPINIVSNPSISGERPISIYGGGIIPKGQNLGR